MYVQVKGTEDVIEIDVDKNRPKSFASKQEANLWEEKTLREILKFKKLVEEGKYVPEEVVQRLEAKPNKTEEELEIIEKWKHVKLDRKEKIEWLKTEASLAQSDLGMILFRDYCIFFLNFHMSIPLELGISLAQLCLPTQAIQSRFGN